MQVSALNTPKGCRSNLTRCFMIQLLFCLRHLHGFKACGLKNLLSKDQ